MLSICEAMGWTEDEYLNASNDFIEKLYTYLLTKSKIESKALNGKNGKM